MSGQGIRVGSNKVDNPALSARSQQAYHTTPRRMSTLECDSLQGEFEDA